ncbi:MAG TPA: peptidogalycan biosysnthesis protein [Catalimonadaceae bacterium]|nr:peptidogalycan biosysnthesis protein [Catalimonadaceae bacterium]HPI09388.1 peptidogalycan biosysnthesis protein [Catalimonadaceae bacterium]
MKICRIPEREITFQVYTNPESIEIDWDGMLPEGHFLRKERLLVMQKCGMPDVSFLYIVVFRKNNCIGLIYGQLFRFHSEHYSPELLDQTCIQIVRNFILRQETGLLICGNLFHLNEPGYFFKDKKDEGLVFQILEQFQKKSSVKISGILLKDAGSDMDDQLASSSRFQRFDNDTVMSVNVDPDWVDFDSYLSAFSKKYRQRANKILQARQSLETRFLSLDEIQAHRSDINCLYQNVRHKQMLRLGSLTPEYFYCLKKELKEDFQVLGWFLDGKMVAFSSHLAHPGNSLEVHYIGFEYEANEKHSIYFNILFEGVRQAIEQKKSKLLFGRTGYDAKASAGAVPETGCHFYRIKRGIPSLAFRYFTSSYRSKENEDWRKRNPFSTTKTNPEAVGA